MNGVINLNKPAGMTSHDVVYRVRKIVGQKRVGHAGTLDPDATGVLLVCLGQATRLSDLLADQGKEYEAVLRLGITTTTEDSSGTVLTVTDPSHINRTDLLEQLPKFTGFIRQIPPMVSAVHHEGKRLYQLARRGITVERESRTIEIESIEALDFSPGMECSATLKVRCGKGTYIRTLCADIGAALGVGGHMAMLSRTSVGRFRLESAVALDDLTPNNFASSVVSSADAVSFLPRVEIDDSLAADVLNGKRIRVEEQFEPGELIRVLFENELLALVTKTIEGDLAPSKVFPRDV